MSASVANCDANRVAWLDTVRGYALLVIPLNHFWLTAISAGLPAFHLPTPSLLGFSSAAELLLLASGYTYFLASRGRLEAHGPLLLQVRALRRGAWLLSANVLMLFAVVGTFKGLGFRPEGITHGFWRTLVTLRDEPAQLVMLALSPFSSLYTFDILPLYGLLLAAAPAILVTLRFHTGLAIGLSVSLYGAAVLGIIDTELLGVHAESFNPLAWQVMFVLGMAAARQGWLRARPTTRLLPAAIAVLVLGLAWALAHRYPVRGLPLPQLPAWSALTAHADLGPLSALHAIAVLFCFVWLFHQLPDRPRRMLDASLGAVGRRGLGPYVWGNIAQFAMVPLLEVTPNPMLASPALNSLLVGGLLAVPMGMERYRLTRARFAPRLARAAVADRRSPSGFPASTAAGTS